MSETLKASEVLDQAFPPEQCIPEATLQLAEEFLGKDITVYFIAHGAWDTEFMLSSHLQSPFTCNEWDCSTMGITYHGLQQYGPVLAELGKKLRT